MDLSHYTTDELIELERSYYAQLCEVYGKDGLPPELSWYMGPPEPRRNYQQEYEWQRAEFLKEGIDFVTGLPLQTGKKSGRKHPK